MATTIPVGTRLTVGRLTDVLVFALGAVFGWTLNERKRRGDHTDAIIGATARQPGSKATKAPQTEATVPVSVLSELALEVWRLGRRIASDSTTSERIEDSYSRLSRTLNDMNVEVHDPTGDPYVEGMHADVVHMPDAVDPLSDALVISEVLRPTVLLNGDSISAPQIMVERAEKQEG